jgi:hypothetical protein
VREAAASQAAAVAGPLTAVALAVKRATAGGATGPVLVFDNATGRSIDIDTRGADDEIVGRFTQAAADAQRADEADFETAQNEPRGRGRPKLGVVAREVTLLPRHRDWLAKQPGGASVALRKLAEDGRRANAQRDNRRAAYERAYHFMSAMGAHDPPCRGSRLISNGLDFYPGADHVRRLYCRA